MNDEIKAAYEACNATHTNPDRAGPCYAPAYLAARVRYHALLVQARLLPPHLADKATDGT